MKSKYKQISILFLAIFLSLSLGVRAEDDEHEDEEAISVHENEEESTEDIQKKIREFMSNTEEGAQLRQFIEKEMPKGTIPWVTQQVSENPYDAYEILQHLMEVREEYLDLKQWQPDVAKIFLDYSRSEVLSHLLSMKIEEGDDSEGTRKKLRQEIEKAFDLKLSLQKAELNNLEDEVEELRTLLKRREDARDKIIERRFNELTGQDEHLEW
ncbi:hypothetical protein [Rubellicoccus peritrichatus]|uniref:Uncharacterized protein n=1 Tax=Rubellicoccus peritrichatus TaxID=3080537 RepID=A0AAQ3L888_9BACT|nr:hypothetical protein [Puniceicoccus sp. CR14]WOO41120.1 hypothetical protein RZN69_21070 [Puniceicoccus sp. CR14]